jgi:hypothetical protein
MKATHWNMPFKEHLKLKRNLNYIPTVLKFSSLRTNTPSNKIKAFESLKLL